MSRPRSPVGRPPAGLNGARVTTYPRLSTRLPSTSCERLRALAHTEGRAMWRVLVDAISRYEPNRQH
jgi:hypothetical protein